MKRTNRYFILFCTFILCLSSVYAQGIKTDIRKGDKLYKKKAYTESEIRFRKVLEHDSTSAYGLFGVAGALYKQGKEKEALGYWEPLSKNEHVDAEQRAQVFHNIGNVYMKEKDYGKSVEAYKMAMRLNPNDEETRYNLVLAQKLLHQQNKGGGGGNNNQNQDQNKDKNDKNKDQQNKDQQNKDQQNKDQQNKDQQNKDQQNKDQQNQKQPQQPKEGQMTPEQAAQILDAYKQDEAQTREKVMREKEKQQKAANARIKQKW